ncbi:alanine--tRNA ligase, partial [Candidatus Woesearchaeota archaeon]|nr:alanine--tRNA ligase [Candidatus Woesearchaeota archaeon]
QEKFDENKLLRLYDNQGISPELVKEEANKSGKEVNVPDDFYAKVAELHEKKEQEHATRREEKLPLEGVKETEALYFDDYLKTENKAKVLKIIDGNVILDKTVAYPTSGGQLHDIGTINGEEIKDIVKQGSVIVHVLSDVPKFKEGEVVTVKVDVERRKQLAQHHTATHIVGLAAKRVLGKHINQAGARKTQSKATLDISHYQSLSDEEIKKIELEANNIVNSKTKVLKKFYPRTEAEQKFGMAIYQGGAVPGKRLRIVEIEGIDVQACGGTHLDNTKEAGNIHILKSTKISDSIVRIEFTAGKAAESEVSSKEDILEESSKILGVEIDELPARVEELFQVWKKARKAAKKKQELSEEDIKLKSKEKFEGDVLSELVKILKTQPEHIIKTVNRFLRDLKDFKN